MNQNKTFSNKIFGCKWCLQNGTHPISPSMHWCEALHMDGHLNVSPWQLFRNKNCTNWDWTHLNLASDTLILYMLNLYEETYNKHICIFCHLSILKDDSLMEGLVYPACSIPLLLMTWRPSSPSHQQLWYWPNSPKLPRLPHQRASGIISGWQWHTRHNTGIFLSWYHVSSAS